MLRRVMASYKVTYFNGRGRAELARLLLVASGQDFEDERFTREEWLSVKSNMPQGKVPVLTVDGKKIPQTGAINRYLSRKLGLYGSSNEEMTVNDIVMGTVDDVRDGLVKAHFEQDQSKKAEQFRNIKEQTIPTFIKHMENLLCENNNGNGFFVGSSITVGDLALLDVMDIVLDKISPAALDQSVKLKEHRERVSNNPKIKKWLEKRPTSEM